MFSSQLLERNGPGHVITSLDLDAKDRERLYGLPRCSIYIKHSCGPRTDAWR